MKKIPVWKNIILIVSVLAIIIVATLAWFYTGPTGTVEGLQLHVGKATYVQVSGDQGNNWQEDLDMEIGINNIFKEISGNGSSFYAPVYTVPQDAEDGGFSTQLSFTEVSEEKGNAYYYEQLLDFRADTVQNVYLSPESFVTAVDGNYIDGAIRVAFFELDESGNETLKYIWAPNSNVRYAGEGFTREGNVEPYYYYQRSRTYVDPNTLTESNSHVTVIPTAGFTNEAGCGYNPTYKFMWTSSDWQELPEGAPAVLSVNGAGEDSGLFYKKLIVRVWLEGHDAECISLLSGQRFTMKLHFTAQEVE